MQSWDHTIIELEDCLLGVENPADPGLHPRFMEEYHIAPYEEETHKGLVRHVLIPRALPLMGELMDLSGIEWRCGGN